MFVHVVSLYLFESCGWCPNADPALVAYAKLALLDVGLTYEQGDVLR